MCTIRIERHLKRIGPNERDQSMAMRAVLLIKEVVVILCQNLYQIRMSDTEPCMMCTLTHDALYMHAHDNTQLESLLQTNLLRDKTQMIIMSLTAASVAIAHNGPSSPSGDARTMQSCL